MTIENRYTWPPEHLCNFRWKESYRFAILNWGTRGDIQPFVALGEELVHRGHRVVLAAREPFRSMAVERGIDLFAMEEDGTADLLRTLDSCNSVPKVLKTTSSYSRKITRIQLQSFWEASREADVILTKVITTAPAIHVAEGRGLPVFLTHLDLGFIPTEHFCLADGRMQDRGKVFNLFMARFMLLTLGLSISDKINSWRKEQGMPMDRFAMRNRSSHLFRFPAFAAWSPHLLERPPDWPEWVIQTGWWWLPRNKPIAERLRAFVEAGPPPVYFGFGAGGIPDKTARTELLLSALRKTGNRGILLRSMVDMRTEFPDYALVAEELPYDWLFPRLKMAVHHGGAGTTGAVVAAGIPSIVIPSFTAQTVWGNLVADKKIGTRLDSRGMSAERLAAALQEMDQPEIRSRARALGALVRNDGGAAQAADEIERRLWDATQEHKIHLVRQAVELHPAYSKGKAIEPLPSPDVSNSPRVIDEEPIPEDTVEEE